MAHGKFAAITSDLLARKGEAAPWTATERAPLPWRQDAAPPVVFAPPPPAPNVPPVAFVPPPLAQNIPPPLGPDAPPPDKIKRCSVRLSGQEYERLGLMAVKQDVTRQQLLQAALSQVLSEMARELARDCACIGKSCAGGCGHTG